MELTDDAALADLVSQGDSSGIKEPNLVEGSVGCQRGAGRGLPRVGGGGHRLLPGVTQTSNNAVKETARYCLTCVRTQSGISVRGGPPPTPHSNPNVVLHPCDTTHGVTSEGLFHTTEIIVGCCTVGPEHTEWRARRRLLESHSPPTRPEALPLIHTSSP